MKFLLVGKYSVIEPLGLMFLESALRELGVEVDILLIGLKPTDNSPRFSNKYDFTGFSTFTGYHQTVFRVAKDLRETLRNKVIIGGPHATFFADECLKYADYVVVGEGFESLKRIVKGEVGDGKVFTPELVTESEIPVPYRKTLYQAYPSYHANPIKNVMASFGCPYTCKYCWNSSYHRLYGKKIVRFRSVDTVVEECETLKDYPLELIFFQDDCFGFNREWLEEFSHKYRKVGVPFHCQMRPESITLWRLQLLKDAGCHGITMAIESSNEEVRLSLLGRSGSNKDILEACSLIKEFGFKLRTEQMLGLPNTTFKDELDLLEMNTRIKPNIAWTSIYAPYLGTDLGDYCKEKGLYDGNNDDLGDNFFSDTQLKFDEDRVKKTNQLLRIFSTCSQMVGGDKLAKKFLDGKNYDFDYWFSTVRKHLYDEDLYRVRK